ncbi:MAG: hypothetical protein ABIZ80_24215 [Bryobacteraceae bacterium]
MPPKTNRWKSVYELDIERKAVGGSPQDLAGAIRNGADLRIYTEFRHNEHIDPSSESDELVQEVSEFGVTYLLEDRWTAGIMSLRQPVALPDGFGPRPSMSFFLYNEDGQQAVARPHLDGRGPQANPRYEMSKFHLQGNQDEDTTAPSCNFIYDFESFRYCVSDEWEEVLHHSAEGEPISGSIDRLASEFAKGRELKVGIRDLCSDFGGPSHEVFVMAGPAYYYTRSKLFIAETHPVVRVKPAIPMLYEPNGWDFGWLAPRTDGVIAMWLVNPYTLQFRRCKSRHAIRWFVR